MSKINSNKSGVKQSPIGFKIRAESLGLILKGLSLSEKRILTSRLSVGKVQDEEPIYLKLFNSLSKGRSIDEIPELRNNPARLKHTKKYLAEKVLEVMGQNAELSPRVAIYQWQSQAEFLYLKGFHHEAIARLYLALELADEYEFWEERVSILEWINKVKLHLGELDEALTIQNKLQETVELLGLLSKLRQLHLQVKVLSMKEGLPRNDDSRKNWEIILNNPVLIYRPLPLRLDMERHIIKAQCLLNLDGPLPASMELKELLLKLEKNEAVLISNPNTVIETWYLNLGLCIELGQEKEIKEGFNFLKSSPFLSKTQNDRKQLLSRLLEGRILIKEGRLIESIELLESITVPPIQDADYTEWMFFLAVAQVYSKKYSQALKSLNAISFDASLFGVHPALQNYLRIIELLVHWGLGNYEFINHRAKALKYHLRKPGGQRRMEYLLVESLKKMSKLNKEIDRRNALIQLKKEAESLAEKHFSERNFMYYFNLIRWIEVELA